MQNGLLLINLGTPDAPTPRAVGRFLREFLADKHVISLPSFLRYPLVYLLIAPFRKHSSAKAYQAIWTKNGSPLLGYSQALRTKLAERLGSSWTVALGMSYGKPSLFEALESLSACQNITILPLYPQFSYAATSAALHQCFGWLQSRAAIPTLKVISDFYSWPAFIEAQAELIQPHLATHDYVLFSYHGIPLRQLAFIGCPNPCKTSPQKSRTQSPCSLSSPKPCYRAQCYSTSHFLAERLGITADRYGTAFQSRLGKAAWLEPYTDQQFSVLIQQGIRQLLVVCPSFVTDCLETLEEIGIRAAIQWKQLGGTTLTLVPSLNAEETWVEGLTATLSMEEVDLDVTKNKQWLQNLN
ncbi:MAG: ferrochelatase [Legionella sp.]|nr:ferrochelatase [Legionella sp.]